MHASKRQYYPASGRRANADYLGSLSRSGAKLNLAQTATKLLQLNDALTGPCKTFMGIEQPPCIICPIYRCITTRICTCVQQNDVQGLLQTLERQVDALHQNQGIRICYSISNIQYEENKKKHMFAVSNVPKLTNQSYTANYSALL